MKIGHKSVLSNNLYPQLVAGDFWNVVKILVNVGNCLKKMFKLCVCVCMCFTNPMRQTLDINYFKVMTCKVQYDPLYWAIIYSMWHFLFDLQYSTPYYLKHSSKLLWENRIWIKIYNTSSIILVCDCPSIFRLLVIICITV